MNSVITYNNMSNTFSNINNVNNANMFNNNNNFTGYIPYSHNYPINFFQTNPIIPSYSNPNIQLPQTINKIPYNINNQNNNSKNQIINPIEKNTNNNKIKTQETDADLIQDLTGNYLNETEDILSEEKVDKKEIEINLGKIVVNDTILNNFPIINLNNSNKYNIALSENILNNDDFFTAIKETTKEDEKNNMNIEEEENTIVPDKFILNIDENIFDNLKDLMNNEQKKLYSNCKQIMFKKVIEIIYDKCLNLILEIKRNIKNRVKKSKSFDLSNLLHNIFKLHNELYNKYLISLNKQPIEENTKEYFTYADEYIKNSNGKTYKCEVCLKEFVNFHKLGGHMSKMHPNCSEKYKKQNDIRKQREGNRKVLDYVKEKLFEKYNLNYRKMKKNDEKEKIKSFIKAHQKEYEILRRKIHRENALKNEEI